MKYLYHRVPKDMEGNILYPLNTLKEKYPDIYSSQVIKYKGREVIMDQFIPTLKCYWNDVLHLSAIHPREVKNALIEAGAENDITIRCYQINPNILDKEKTTVYFSGDVLSERMNLKNFTDYEVDDLGEYSSLPEETIDYYRDEIRKDVKPLLFHKTPHILYRGSIDIKNCPIVEV